MVEGAARFNNRGRRVAQPCQFCAKRQEQRAGPRQQDAACTVVSAVGAGFRLEFPEAQWAVTPGQSAVLYDGEVCLGGGVIAAVDPSA